MNIGVLGTGMVGATIASRLVSLGHSVMMGSRSATNPKALAWVEKAGKGARAGTFADAARHGELVFNCTKGEASLDVLRLATKEALDGKILVDVSNPLDFSKGMPPTLLVTNTDSLGEQIQRAYPTTKVVKTLNTVNCDVMVDPGKLPGEHAMFVCGDDTAAKAKVTSLLSEQFGWRSVIDLGPISSARATEGYLMLWVRLFGVLQTPRFNIAIVRAASS